MSVPRYRLEPLHWVWDLCPNLKIGIPQQCLSHRFEVLINFGKVFALFLGAFIVEYSLFIVIVIKCYLLAYLSGTPRRLYNYGSCCKTLVYDCDKD